MVRIIYIRLLEENISINIHAFGLGNGLSDMTLKGQATKENINKLEIIIVKNVCVLKDTINKEKRKSTELYKFL